MKRKLGRAVALGLVLLAVVSIAGGVSVARLTDDDDEAAPAVSAQAEAEADERYPLAAGTTAESVQVAVYERAFSECASVDLKLLAAKYKAADTSSRGVADIVGRAWASYFKAGRDAVLDGRDGCLQGQQRRASDQS